MKTPKYRSTLEQRFHQNNPQLQYEITSFEYIVRHSYTPDFYDAETNTYLETKGLWDAADRAKIVAVLKQNPGINLVMVFQNPNLKIRKGSKTTYADFCDKKGIKWKKA